MTMDNSDGIRSVVLRRSSDAGLGFSIMGGAGYEFPPVIYGIEADSPAARSGLLEAGDIILAINEREVVRLSTKEVLKCLRLSGDIVNITYKRDPHVVNRVREFLSAPPSYVEQGRLDAPCFFTPTQVTITPSSPQKLPIGGSGSNKASKIRLPSTVLPISPNRPPTTSPTSASPPLKKKTIQSLDEIDSSRGVNPNYISFSEDIFNNHTHIQQQKQHTTSPIPAQYPIGNKSLIPVRSPPYSINSEKNNGSSNGNNRAQRNNAATTSTPIGQVTGNKKNYEMYVMTGDAILNVSKLRNEDSIRSSPTKTTSKLTPLPHGPAPPHQIYTSPRPTKSTTPIFPPPVPAAIHDRSEDIATSPPLPPPPTSNSVSSSTSDSITHITVKSDNLPPPPPSLMMEDEQTAQSQSNGMAIAEAVVIRNECNANTLNGGLGNLSELNFPLEKNKKSSEVASNNEDTSISSSVMSDSGGEDGDENFEFDGETKDSKRRNLYGKKCSLESETGQDGDPPVKKEKDRYNEYVLLNGSGCVTTVGVDEDRSSTEVKSVQAFGYEKMTNRSPNDSEEEGSVVAGSDDGEESTPPGKRLRKLVSGESSYSGGDSDGSDVESMRIAPVTKAVDLPSAERLAKRLYTLDGFKVSGVWRQLSKANDFSREVATYFLRYFEFKDETLDVSLRKFLNVCPLRGETQERERVLTYFSTRYVECNPNFASQDAVHTLACALMLLNTDIYSGARGERRMSCKDFIQNLVGLNDGQNFPEPVLKKLYHAIKSKPLASPQEVDEEESAREVLPMDPSVTSNTKEFKRGYLKRKSIFEQGGKKTPLGKRSWKLYFCRLRELLLSLAPDENSKATVVHNIPALKLHHCLATIASDYRKKPYVFCLTLADKSQYLFQSSDIREMHSWIDNLNLNAAKFSSPALDAPCGSFKKFEKPLLTSAISRLSSRDQLITHQGALAKWKEELEELMQAASAKRGRENKKDTKERSEFYKCEIQRYHAYVDVLERHLSDLNISGLEAQGEELVELQVLPNPPSVLIEMDEN